MSKVEYDHEILAIGAEPGVIQITTKYTIRTFQITDIVYQEMEVKDRVLEIIYTNKTGTYNSNHTLRYLYAPKLESKVKKALLKAYTIQYKKLEEI